MIGQRKQQLEEATAYESCAALAARGASSVLSAISSVTWRMALSCGTPTDAEPAVPACSGLTADDVLSAGEPGSRRSAVHLLDGVARWLASEAELAEDYALCEELIFVTADLVEARDRIVGVEA